jgi:cell pole-organizing protein PopZ
MQKIKPIIIAFFVLYFVIQCTIAKAENDTATTGNILPNAGTTSSSRDNFDLDGVQSGSTGALGNNSTHNGFDITCPTQVNNACGTAFSGELETSYQMKVGASGTLLDIDGVENGTTYTSTQKKLDGGIQLNSYFSIQNCEDGNSSYSCGVSSGAEDSYKLHVKIKDAQGNTLAQMTTTRLEDAGYNANSRQFQDNLVWNGTGGASYEWYWEGYDGSLNTNTSNLGPNLLGAELLLDFPIDDHEPLSTQEIADINAALNTTELTENEIYDIISGLESMIEEEFFASGNLEEGTRLELSIEETGLTFEIASKETGAIVMESPMVAQIMEEMPIQTLKEEMVTMIQEESKTFMEALETPKEEKSVKTVKEEMTNEPKQKQAIAQQPKETITKEEPKKNAPRETVKTEKKPNSKGTVKSTRTQAAGDKEQEAIQEGKAKVANIARVMKKIDQNIKDKSKNLQIKNLIKIDAMTSDQVSLNVYNVPFYKPKDIYLDQLNMQDNRLIYENVSLASYVENDKININKKKLNEIQFKKQQILLELERLRNG